MNPNDVTDRINAAIAAGYDPQMVYTQAATMGLIDPSTPLGIAAGSSAVGNMPAQETYAKNLGTTPQLNPQVNAGTQNYLNNASQTMGATMNAQDKYNLNSMKQANGQDLNAGIRYYTNQYATGGF